MRPQSMTHPNAPAALSTRGVVVRAAILVAAALATLAAAFIADPPQETPAAMPARNAPAAPASSTARVYSASLHRRGAEAIPLTVLSVPAAELCVGLPEAGSPELYVLDVRGKEHPAPLWLHLYATDRGWRLAGLERPSAAEEPRW